MSTFTRRDALKTFAAAASVAALPSLQAEIPGATHATMRPSIAERKFRSKSVDEYILATKNLIGDAELAWLFENCFPNTLDTTTEAGEYEGKPDTVIITGDIPAMWLRDSSAQVWPYLPLATNDEPLRRMLEGVIRRQARCLLVDPYANAFLKDLNEKPTQGGFRDKTVMKNGVWERKYELDSLCYPLRLAHGYWKHTGGTQPFDAQWVAAMRTVLRTMREQQRKDGPGPYTFERVSPKASETLQDGVGNPVKPCGLIASGFRPSDDACIFHFLVPSNLFAVTSLRQLAEIAHAIHEDGMANEAVSLAAEVERALQQHAIAQTASGSIWAYEVDGYGSRVLMDDANAPGLLSLPYLNASPDAALYARTRAFVWSAQNPYFFKGSAGEGIGGPHVGKDMVWPMSQIVYAATSTSDDEIRRMLTMLKASSAGTGFMHESYFKDDPKKFTRSWFAWANTLFGELVANIAHSKPALLR